MQLRQIIGALLSTSVLTTTVVMPQTTVYAASTFASATEFLEAVVDTALMEIDSPSKDTAVTTTMSKFAVTGDVVSFNGSIIGYWDSSASNTLYADVGKTTEIIEETANGYEVSPTLLHTILNDVNSNIVENYVPATSDWSKIIGKYDVTLGDITIPASQWVNMEVDDVNSDPLTNNKALDIFTLTGKKGSDLSTSSTDDSVFVMAYLIDQNGDLYLGDYILSSRLFDSEYYPFGNSITYGNLSIGTYPYTGGYSTSSKISQCPYIKVALKPTSDTSELACRFYTTSVAGDKRYQHHTGNGDSITYKLLKVDNPQIKNATPYAEAKKIGIVWFYGKQMPTGVTDLGNNSRAFIDAHVKMFESRSSSKLVKGNQKLTRRLSVVATLLSTDTVTVTPTNWTVNGYDNNIDNYIINQQIYNAGDTADISAIADIEALKFHVIVPTTLPIYVDDANVTYVADNADITNKSGAAVKLTDVDIVPVADSGWTMVDATPSPEIGAKEFTFATTIEKNRVLAVNEVYPFEYSAKLSPTTEACMNLELATVLVTVDWAE